VLAESYKTLKLAYYLENNFYRHEKGHHNVQSKTSTLNMQYLKRHIYIKSPKSGSGEVNFCISVKNETSSYLSL